MSPPWSKLKTVTRQAVWLAGARGTGILASLAGAVLLGHSGDKAVFGAYGLAITLVAIWGVVMDGGIGSAAVVRLAADPSLSLGGHIRLRVSYASAWGAVVVVGGTVVAVGHPRLGMVIAVSGASAALIAASAGLLTGAQVRLRNDLGAAVDVVAQVVGLALLVGAVAQGAPLGFVLGSLLGSNVVRFLATFAVSCRSGMFEWSRLDPASATAVWRDAKPILLWNGIGTIHIKAGALVVYAVLGAAQFAPYAVAFRVVDLLLVGPGILFTATLPVLSAAFSSDRRRYRQLQQQVIGVLFPSGVIAAGTVLVSAPTVSKLITGSADSATVNVLRLYAVSGLCIWINTLFVAAMLLQGRQSRAVRVGVASLALNAGLALALVPALGVTSGAVASVVAEAFLTTGLGLLVSRGEPIRWTQAALSSVMMVCFVVIGFSVAMFAGSAAGAVVTAALGGSALAGLRIRAGRARLAPDSVHSSPGRLPISPVGS